jgi:hypothetical protein
MDWVLEPLHPPRKKCLQSMCGCKSITVHFREAEPNEHSSVARPLWIWSSVWAKISLAITLIRVKVSPLSRALMSAFIIILPLLILALWVPVLVKKTSLSTFADLKTRNGLYLGIASKYCCIVKQMEWLANTGFVVVFLLADLVLTVPPVLFLFNKRPVYETSMAWFLCFLGLCAVACSTGRVFMQTDRFIHTIYRPPKTVGNNGLLVSYIVLASVEASISIIAACTPTLFHLLSSATFLIPASCRERTVNRQSTLYVRRHQSDSSQRNSKGESVIDRWSRDLGLDALPDNPRLSTIHRRRPSRWSWRKSVTFTVTKHDSITRIEEAPRKYSEIAESPYVAGVYQPSQTTEFVQSQSTIGDPNSWQFPTPPTARVKPRPLVREAPPNSWSRWGSSPQIEPQSALAPHGRDRRSSNLSTWLKWERQESNRKELETQRIKASEMARGQPSNTMNLDERRITLIGEAFHEEPTCPPAVFSMHMGPQRQPVMHQSKSRQSKESGKHHYSMPSLTTLTEELPDFILDTAGPNIEPSMERDPASFDLGSGGLPSEETEREWRVGLQRPMSFEPGDYGSPTIPRLVVRNPGGTSFSE